MKITVNHFLPARRGALLLVVLGLLAMFGLVAVALVVLATHARHGSFAVSLIDSAANPPRQDLNKAAMQIFRGSNSPCSVMGAYSLLEDMYGNMSITGTINGVTPLCTATGGTNGQILELTLVTSSGTLSATNTSVRCLGGCVFTDLGNPSLPSASSSQSPAAGQSTFIVGIHPTVNGDPNSGYYQIAAFDNAALPNYGPQNGDVFVINGAPFSGPGLGCTSGSLDKSSSSVALKPGLLHLSISSTADYGANCDYTAPDYEHPLLAAQEPAVGSNGMLSPGGTATMTTPLPSLHRPELIKYAGGTPDHTTMLRPFKGDHPNFTGSNPNFDPINGPWDVCNDGDGVPDSVWVDLGFPVRAAADGRLYKPLFAILCVDLDGRLNLNAHGNLTAASAGTGLYAAPDSSVTNDNPLSQSATPPSLASGGGTVYLERGFGFGPAEINLFPLFSASAGSGASYLQSLMQSRYGADGLPGYAGGNNISSALDYNKWYNYVGNYWGNGGTNSGGTIDAYGSPPDPQGFGALGLDEAGRPMFLSSGTAIKNSPYDLDLSRGAAHGLCSSGTALGASGAPPDNPFGVAELERVLRPFDRDSSILPSSRLLALSGGTGQTLTGSIVQQKRYAVTTEQWDVPCPATAVPKLARGNLGSFPQHITDLLKARNVPQKQWAALVPAEILAGLRLNLNPPLGYFSQASSTTTTLASSFSQYTSPTTPTSGTINYDAGTINPSGTTTYSAPWGTPMQARLRQARYLYVLAMLLRDPGSTATVLPVTSAAEKANQTALDTRRIAQWAINAVCFATNDSVMAPFKYDPKFLTDNQGWHLQDDLINPADGTTPSSGQKSGDNAGTFGVVWGCKPPELLLSEAAAFHNRGVADTKNDNGTGKNEPATRETLYNAGTTTSPNYVVADPDMDQVRVPQGSLFIELYCPRSPTNSVAPSDLYSYQGASGGWCLDVGRTAPDGTPVWRIVVGSSRYVNPPYNDVSARLDPNQGGLPDSSAIEPEQYPGDSKPEFTLLPLPGSTTATGTNSNVTIDRQIFMTTTPPPSTLAGASTMSFYNFNSKRGNNNALPGYRYLPGGHYLVLGPRGRTYIGAGYTGTNPGVYTANTSLKIQYIDLVSSQGVTYVPNGSTSPTSPQVGSQIKQPYTMIISSSAPSSWQNQTTTTNGIGMNISEPLYSSSAYYTPEPTQQGPDDYTGDNPGWYDSYTKPGANYIDRPMETTLLMPGLTPPQDALAQYRPLVMDAKATGGKGLLQTHTETDYKTLFLQRLANPSIAYDPVINPYRTVDWLPVDLTVFNGTDYNTQNSTHGWGPTTRPSHMNPAAGQGTPGNAAYAAWDYDDPVAGDPNYVSGKTLQFGSRQRGGTAATALALQSNYSGCFNTNPWTAMLVSAGSANEPAPISAWPPLGAGAAPAVGGANFPINLQHTLGFLNVGFWTNPGNTPPTGFNARSDATYMGDAQGSDGSPFPWIAWNNRPYASPWELLAVPSCHPARLLWEYQMNPTKTTPNPYTPTAPGSTCPYNPYTPTAGGVPYPYLLGIFQSGLSSASTAPQLYRLLEYVGVPSRFVQTETFINPSYVNGSSAAQQTYTPPFNRISRYREPGRINLNTIYSQDVLNGLMNNFPGTNDGTLWTKFVQSRRSPPGGPSYSAANTSDPLAMDSSGTYPTRFGNPFRSFAGGDMNFAVPSREIDATVLRCDPGNTSRPLFQFDRTGTFAPAPANDPDRNPYFRYQLLSRLGNLVTTRSNVYAVWITVGYFEVTPNGGSGTIDAAHPDGYQLGAELGADTGEIERHRAFFIFDRTIPVGFVRGQDFNVEKAVLLRRYIE
jgi:hypothetical protein